VCIFLNYFQVYQFESCKSLRGGRIFGETTANPQPYLTTLLLNFPSSFLEKQKPFEPLGDLSS
jgi:hypothetical protein